MVWRNQFGEDIVKFTVIIQETVRIHGLTQLREKLEIIQQSLLELDRLAHILVVNNALDAMAEVRRREVKRVIDRLTFEFDWQFHLTGAAGRNLKKDHAKCEGVRRRGSLKELNVDICLLALRDARAILREPLDFHQM